MEGLLTCYVDTSRLNARGPSSEDREAAEAINSSRGWSLAEVLGSREKDHFGKDTCRRTWAGRRAGRGGGYGGAARALPVASPSRDVGPRGSAWVRFTAGSNAAHNHRIVFRLRQQFHPQMRTRMVALACNMPGYACTLSMHVRIHAMANKPLASTVARSAT